MLSALRIAVAARRSLLSSGSAGLVRLALFAPVDRCCGGPHKAGFGPAGFPT